MPFPPQKKDVNFDFEAILNNNVRCTVPYAHFRTMETDGMQRALEQHLTTTTDSTKLLKSTLEQEKKSLALDKAELERLEKDCRGAETLRKRNAKNVSVMC